VTPPSSAQGRLGRGRAWYRQALAGALDDLPVFAWYQCVALLVGTLAAKLLAVAFALRALPLAERAAATLRVLPLDLLFVAAMFAAVLAADLIPRVGPRLRAALHVLLSLGPLVVLGVLFVDVEFFTSWGAPLSWELLQLAPAVAGYVFLVGVSDKSGALTTGAVLAIASLVAAAPAAVRLRPLLRRGAGWQRRALLPVPLLILLAALGLARSPRDSGESALRRLNVVTLVVPRAAQRHFDAAPASPAETEALRDMLGPPSDAGRDALAPFPRRRMNVVVWVWESVGARYLKTFSPLGDIPTPQLDRALHAGGVAFTRFTTESPVSSQTTWALLTGTSPPAQPLVFALHGFDPTAVLPAHAPPLQQMLKDAGYRTAIVTSTLSRVWGQGKIFQIAPLDRFEDPDTIDAPAAARSGLGVSDDLMASRAQEWALGSADQPFFLMFWNVETHNPYTWVGMPRSLHAAAPYDRYRAAVQRADATLGAFLDALDARGLRDDTLVVLVGDHGQGFSRSKPWDVKHGNLVFEDDLAVPAAFLHPSLRAPGGRAVAVPASHVDLYATILDLVGLEIPASANGRSLARTFAPAPSFSRAATWWPLSVRVADYKLILDEPGAVPALYDLAQDPLERTDASRAQPTVARLLHLELQRFQATRLRTDPTIVSTYRWTPEALQQFRMPLPGQ
jgi:lipoteichoic acid synthase